MKKRLVVGISGGSGIPLATELLSQLQKIEEIETHLVYTRGAEVTAAQESELSMEEICALADVVYDNKDIGAAIASGGRDLKGAQKADFSCEGMPVQYDSSAQPV